LIVWVATTGAVPDVDGYQIRIDGRRIEPMGPSQLSVVLNIDPGVHRIELIGVDRHCRTNPSDGFSIEVLAGSRSRVDFEVQCPNTGVAILVVSSGPDRDLGFAAVVDDQIYSLSAGEPLSLTRLAPGNHQVTLGEIAPNCHTVGGLSATAAVNWGQVVAVEFAVVCRAITGFIRVNTVSAGQDLDPDGYVVRVDNQGGVVVGSSGAITLGPLAEGGHVVELGGVTSNCVVQPLHSRTVTVVAGDTTNTSFQVGCRRLWSLAFSRDGRVVLASDAGMTVVRGDGTAPTWSADGNRLAYDCGPICVAAPGGPVLTRVGVGGSTDDPNQQDDDSDPAWRPGTDMIAVVNNACYTYYSRYDYCYFTGLYLVAASPGGERIRIPVPDLIRAGDLAWSPDGRRLAFTCYFEWGNQDVCVVDADGRSFRRLTDDPAADLAPDWSPDGLWIAFSTDRHQPGRPEISLVDPDGQRMTRVRPGTPGSDPAWSPDGSTIAFGSCPAPADCGLFLMSPDGSHLRRLTTGFDLGPVWRR
jgi:hypothetical protein